MKGRTPKPTKIKELAGNPGKRKQNKNEPQYSKVRSDAPPELDKIGQQEWDRIVGEMRANGVLTKCDEVTLLSYCDEYSIMIHAMKELRTPKTKAMRKLLKTSKNGMEMQNPYLAIVRKSRQVLKGLSAELGLSPASRSRVTAAPTTPDEDDYAALRKRRDNSLIQAQQRFGKRKNKKAKNKAK